MPLRFIVTAPAWGVLAGVLLAWAGDSLLLTRWAPGTLVLVHALALGVLGNVMLGSLMQFLPAAAGVTPWGGNRAAFVLHAVFNVGTAMLLAGFWWSAPRLLGAAAGLLVGAFLLLAAMTLPGLLRVATQRLLTRGIALAVACGVVASALGARMALGLAGYADWGLPQQPWADVHAAWALLGWVGILLASVSQVVMPMFQGTRPIRSGWLVAWLLMVVLALLGATLQAARDAGEELRWTVALAALAFTLEAMWRQRGRSRRTDAPLVMAWRVGLAAVASGAVALLWGAPATVSGALVLGLGLPMLLVGMLLEIVAFLGWITLRRTVPRGTRVPGVNRLLGDGGKKVAIAGVCLSGVLVVAASAWPTPLLAHAAGVATAAAYCVLLLVLARVARRSSTGV
ncbi:hypothetical protein [Novilysobacter selenitireducens]|uniref:Uncharacterized protein n=1 Tax=Novilysobacter selenitireducens TaxID=2872639 RepID=A0ABS7T7Y7_9GAMM|nr:hypothetical protein [Lysobacter selenitireducens]MBZ4039997.1 hypothetical protein [Lysobacter selenitireducens]